MHTKYKHPKVEVDSLDKSTSALNIESVDLYMYVQQEASQQEEDRPPHQEKKRAENCRGRSKPKSYTIEFKKQTLDLLDNFSSSRNKMAKSCRCQTSKQIFGSEVEQSKKFDFVRNCQK